jgi:F-type H+-transporting ATPase subunit delta
MEDPAVSEYFRDPNVGEDQRLGTIGIGFAGIGPQTLNLLRILAVKQRLYLLPPILREFEELERTARGMAEAHIVVARPVDEQEEKGIADQLTQSIGKTVEVRIEVDPAILGGIVVRIGDRLIDASVAGNLQRLRQQMV